VIFDKTGTLTSGQPQLSVKGNADADGLALASASRRDESPILLGALK